MLEDLVLLGTYSFTVLRTQKFKIFPKVSIWLGAGPIWEKSQSLVTFIWGMRVVFKYEFRYFFGIDFA